MQDLKSVLFGGYSQESVENTMEQMRKKQVALENEIESKSRVISELTNKLLDYRDKELYISESLIEAREVAKKIVDDAQRRADNLYNAAQEEVREKLKSTEKILVQLDAVKQNMIYQHKELKEELIRLITQYGEAIELANLEELTSIESEIEQNKVLVNELLGSADYSTNKLIVLPDKSLEAEEEPVFVFEQ